MNPSSPINGPWRLLILDASDSIDPHWLICSVTLPEDVRPAGMEPDGRRYAEWPAVAQWVRDRIGGRVELVPIAAIAWRIDEGQPR